MAEPRYPRDLRGYGRNPPDPKWPGGARVAVQFVVNFEEGGENNILHGDAASEAFLSDVLGAQPWPDQRHANIESMFEYGSRAGFWRLWRMFTERNMPVTVFGVATALQRNPGDRRGDERGGLGYRQPRLEMDPASRTCRRPRSAAEIAEAIRLHTQATGARPLGWYTGRSSINTLGLVLEEGGFHYVSDSYADDLPYWSGAEGGRSSSSPTRSTPTTCALSPRRALAAARNSSPISRTVLTCSMRKARRRRR